MLSIGCGVLRQIKREKAGLCTRNTRDLCFGVKRGTLGMIGVREVKKREHNREQQWCFRRFDSSGLLSFIPIVPVA